MHISYVKLYIPLQLDLIYSQTCSSIPIFVTLEMEGVYCI